MRKAQRYCGEILINRGRSRLIQRNMVFFFKQKKKQNQNYFIICQAVFFVHFEQFDFSFHIVFLALKGQADRVRDSSPGCG